ncbi:MAG: AEC family transporter [Gammaproteobacteria bacterium]|nr:AEC family transporter [Gammaproteobacteria bacterium]
MADLSLQILGILAPSVLLTLIGIGWLKFGPAYPVPFVTTLVINISLPALLFHTLATADVALASLSRMAIATLAVHVLSLPVAYLLLKKAGKDWHLSVALIVGNTGNLGLPICYLAFGDIGLAYAITFFSVQCLLMFSFGDAVYAGQISLKRVVTSPILYAIILGIVVRIADWTMPDIALDTTDLLGQMTIPIMLITLGVSLGGMKVTQLPSNILWGAISVVLGLAVGLFVAELFGLDGVARAVLVIQCAVPVAVFNYLLAARHGRDTSEVSGLILVTHIAAVIYLPVLLSFLLR